MAQQRLDEAKLLRANNFLQGAYYIAGYAVEFSLKALVCKRLGIEVFEGMSGMQDVSKALQTHNLGTLIVFAGLHQSLSVKKAEQVFLTDWSRVSEWSEQRRYEPLTCNPLTVQNFINSTERVMAWILSHY